METRELFTTVAIAVRPAFRAPRPALGKAATFGSLLLNAKHAAQLLGLANGIADIPLGQGAPLVEPSRAQRRSAIVGR